MACIYLDAGSGALRPVSMEMIQAVRSSVKLPIIVGGGIKSSTQMQQAFDAGADWVVIGSWLEESPELIANL
jgi:putative glycerol-1-phosphate prenyltransferase